MIHSALISVQELKQIIHNPDVKLIEATVPHVDKRETLDPDLFIPNTISVDIKTDFARPNAPYPNTVPEVAQFEQTCSRLGISNDDHVVVYDKHGIFSAPRIWWLFHLMGHHKVSVLNGGQPAWKASGESLVSETKSYAETQFKAKPEWDWFADTPMVLDASERKQQILDARGKARFDGTVPEPREGIESGHIPHSENLPFDILLSDNQYKPKEELRELFAQKVNLNDELLFTCGSGMTACILLLAAYSVEPKPYKIYDGSWSEWGTKVNGLPIETA